MIFYFNLPNKTQLQKLYQEIKSSSPWFIFIIDPPPTNKAYTPKHSTGKGEHKQHKHPASHKPNRFDQPKLIYGPLSFISAYISFLDFWNSRKISLPIRILFALHAHQQERLQQQQVRFRGIFLLLGSSQHCSQDHRQARRTRRRRLWRKKRGRPAKESPFPPYSPPRTNIMLSTIMFDFTARAITFPFLLDFPVSFCLLLFFEDLEVQIEVKKGRGDSSIPRSSRLRGRWSKLDHVQRSSSSNNINLLLIQWGKTKLR